MLLRLGESQIFQVFLTKMLNKVHQAQKEVVFDENRSLHLHSSFTFSKDKTLKYNTEPKTSFILNFTYEQFSGPYFRKGGKISTAVRVSVKVKVSCFSSMLYSVRLLSNYPLYLPYFKVDLSEFQLKLRIKFYLFLQY